MHLSRSAEYVVFDGKFLVAEVLDRSGRSITANLYKNPEAFVQDDAMERDVNLWLRCPQPYHRGCLTFSRQGSSEDAALPPLD